MAKKYSKVDLKYQLFDKENNIIGYEYHESNIHGVVQIYHQDIKEGVEKKLVREGHSIVHFDKKLCVPKYYSTKSRLSTPPTKFKELLAHIIAECSKIEQEVVLKESKFVWREDMIALEKICKIMFDKK